MRTSAAAVIAGVAIAGPGCAIIDPGRPIGIDVGGLDHDDAANVEEGARCWGLAFGIDFRFGPDARTADQSIEAFYDEQTCLAGTAAQVQGTWPVAIAICPPRYWGNELGVELPMASFRVLSHELGHALNIIGHPATPHAVMGIGPDPGFPMFHPDDERMFREANPGFVVQSPCAGTVMRRNRPDNAAIGRCTCE